MLLQGYAVFKCVDEPDMPKENDPLPFKIVRVQVAYGDPIPTSSLQKATQFVEVIAGHASRNMAIYWATQLNEGRCTEEKCKEEIEQYR